MTVEPLTYLKQKERELIELLADLVSRDTPSSDKQAIDNFARHLAARFAGVGCTTRILPGGQQGDHLLATAGTGTEQILILCHMDTVWPRGEAERWPFTVCGQRASGPGVFDMKAGIAMAIFALQALRKSNREPRARLAFLCTSDEEIGSPSSRPLIEQEARRSRAVLILEPSTAPDGALKTARKGVGTFQLTVRGQASHAGVAPEEGVSALVELAHQILKLDAMNDPGSGVTVNVGTAAGGSRPNVVPAEAQAQVDLRVTSVGQAREYAGRIRQLTPHLPGARIEVLGGLNRPPMERTARTAKLFALARRIAGQLGFELAESSSGGASDGNFTAALGIPTLDGLGAVGDGSHAYGEYILLPHLPGRTALLAELMAAIE